VPPEVFMAPPIISDKKKTWKVILATSLGSLVGGAISYMIGLWLYDSIGHWIIETFSSPQDWLTAKDMFVHYGILIIFIAAFTPVPFKLLAMCAGFIHFNAFVFLGISAIFRALRFMIVGGLIYKYQNGFRKILDKYFWQTLIVGIIIAIAGLFVLSLV
jgi:membrane protein YqaA with SNARE-associated domain